MAQIVNRTEQKFAQRTVLELIAVYHGLDHFKPWFYLYGIE